MITFRMTAEAEAAATRYGTVVDAWRALYNRALDQGNFGSTNGLVRVQEEAYAIARSFLEIEVQQIQRVSAEISLGAYRATLAELNVSDALDLTDAASGHLSDAESYLERELTIQIERDIAFLLLSLRRAVLMISLAARAQGVSVRQTLMQFRIGNTGELQFFFHDRGNQKWSSRKFVRAVWRHHLIGLYNETVLMTLSDYGLDQAQIKTVDPKSPVNGKILSMSPNRSQPTYDEIRGEIFHPNSDSILARAA